MPALGTTSPVLAWLAAAALALLQLAGADVSGARAWLGAAGVAAAAPVMASVVGARSPGALDNASGVAALLLDGVRFDANKGTPMKQWLALDPASDRSWSDLAREALEFAAK